MSQIILSSKFSGEDGHDFTNYLNEPLDLSDREMAVQEVAYLPNSWPNIFSQYVDISVEKIVFDYEQKDPLATMTILESRKKEYKIPTYREKKLPLREERGYMFVVDSFFVYGESQHVRATPGTLRWTVDGTDEIRVAEISFNYNKKEYRVHCTDFYEKILDAHYGFVKYKFLGMKASYVGQTRPHPISNVPLVAILYVTTFPEENESEYVETKTYYLDEFVEVEKKTVPPEKYMDEETYMVDVEKTR